MKRTVLILFFIVALSLPQLSFAAGFIPCGGAGEEPCQACHLVTLGQTILEFVIGIMIGIIGLVFIFGGMKMVTSAGNTESVSTAKHMMTNAIIGFVILLAAWIVVDTVLKTFTSGSQFGTWNKIQCVAQPEAIPPEEGGVTVPPTSTTTPPTQGSGVNCPAADPSTVIPIPASATRGDAEKALASTVEKFLAMREAALKDAIDLKVTDAWRSESEQVSLWNANCSSGTCGAIKVAKPCSLGGNGSNHNSGSALDIYVGCSNGSSNCSTNEYKWLKANGSTWGFNNALPTDPLHWSPSGR